MATGVVAKTEELLAPEVVTEVVDVEKGVGADVVWPPNMDVEPPKTDEVVVVGAFVVEVFPKKTQNIRKLKQKTWINFNFKDF